MAYVSYISIRDYSTLVVLAAGITPNMYIALYTE